MRWSFLESTQPADRSHLQVQGSQVQLAPHLQPFSAPTTVSAAPAKWPFSGATPRTRVSLVIVSEELMSGYILHLQVNNIIFLKKKHQNYQELGENIESILPSTAAAALAARATPTVSSTARHLHEENRGYKSWMTLMFERVIGGCAYPHFIGRWGERLRGYPPSICHDLTLCLSLHICPNLYPLSTHVAVLEPSNPSFVGYSGIFNTILLTLSLNPVGFDYMEFNPTVFRLQYVVSWARTGIWHQDGSHVSFIALKFHARKLREVRLPKDKSFFFFFLF